MTGAQPLDAAAVEQLVRKLLECAKAHYLLRPTVRASALEVLNAAAILVATIIHGARECGDEDAAHAFFNLALAQQLSVEVRRDFDLTLARLRMGSA